jgi:hypothetical protein
VHSYFGRQYELMHPGLQSLISRGSYMACFLANDEMHRRSLRLDRAVLVRPGHRTRSINRQMVNLASRGLDYDVAAVIYGQRFGGALPAVQPVLFVHGRWRGVWSNVLVQAWAQGRCFANSSQPITRPDG